MTAPTLLVFSTCTKEIVNLEKLLAARGYNTCTANGDHNIQEIVADQNPQLAIACATSDCIQKGLNAIKKIRLICPTLPVILIANRSSETLAIGAIKAGVSDYFTPPYSHDDLFTSIHQNIAIHPSAPYQNLSYPDPHSIMVCVCKQMKELKSYLSKIAAIDTTVLITGETGTGKELVAEMIHQQSNRQKKPLVSVNCAALPENLVESELFGYEKGAFTGATTSKIGKFRQASGGTLFLDEIGDMSLFAQAKVLRSLDLKQVSPLGGQELKSLDLRVIAATNKDLEDLIVEGNFRQDLYYRLNLARVYLPPLRDRREDIPALVCHAIRKFNLRHQRNVKHMTDEALDSLLQYDWPGNVRELMNLLETTYINLSDDRIDYIDLPDHFRNKIDETECVSRNERSRIVSALLETKWNKSATAKILNWSRMTLYRKIQMYNIVENRRETNK